MKEDKTRILLSPNDLAGRWRLTETTLSQWRWNGRGPSFIKVGKGILYRLSEIEHFEDQHTCQNTSEYGGIQW